MRLIYHCVWVLLFPSCISPADIDLEDRDTQYVVDAILETGDRRRTIISISKSRSVSEVGQSVGFRTISNAQVYLERQDGWRFAFVPVGSNSGRHSAPDNFMPVPGESYRLIINVDGRTLQTERQTVLATPDLEDIFFDISQRFFTRGSIIVDETVMGFSEPLSNDASLLRYDYDITYEVFQQRPGIDCDFEEEVPEICYRTEESTKFINVIDLSEPDIDPEASYEVITIDPERRLEGTFSIRIIQKAINEEAYKYWSQIKKQLENNGGLFDPIPGPVRGNIFFEDDPENRILGFFELTQTKAHRIFAFPEDLEETFTHYRCVCAVDIRREDPCPPPEGPPIFPSSCCDCRLWGNSSETKPEYWP